MVRLANNHWARTKDGEIIENPPEEGADGDDGEYDDFDNIVQMANEGASDEEAEMDQFDRYWRALILSNGLFRNFGTGERIGDTDHSFVMDRFLGDDADMEAVHQYRGRLDFFGHFIMLIDMDDRSIEAEDDRMSTGSERKTRFTSYSMTSSIMRRSEKLVNLDDQFEELFLGKYDDDKVGDLQHENLDDNEIELDSQLLQNAIETDYANFVPEQQTVMDTLKGDKELKKSALEFVENYNSDEDDADVQIVEVKEKPKWDCETIISTYSNLYNRPKGSGSFSCIFAPIRLFLSRLKVLDDGFSTKSGAISLKKLQKGPKTVRTSSELKKMEQEYQEERGELKLKVQKREKGETKEEKKARKQVKVEIYL